MDTLIFVGSDLTWARESTPRTRLACPQNGRRATVDAMTPTEVRDYLERVDGDRFREAWAATVRTLNRGTSCLRFRTTDDVDFDLIAGVVAGTSVERLIGFYERTR